MISWIQVTFEKHTKVFLAFLLLVITIPFVFTIGAAPGIGRGDRAITKREFFGHNLVNQGDTRRISLDAQVSILLRSGYSMPLNGAQMQDYAFQRTAALALADRYRIPAPTAAERSKFLATLPIFQNEQGQFDSLRYNEFRDKVRKNQAEITEADVARVLGEECRIQQIDTLLAGPGYIAPVEVANEIALGSTRWTLRVAAFDLATFNPTIKPSEDVLQKFFEDNAAAFEIPERISADFVTFAAADFMAADPLSDDDVVAFFEANKQRFATPAAEGKPAAEPTLVTARPQVEAAMRTSLAARRAASAASDFAYDLFEQKLPKDSPAINALVAKYKGRRATAPLFSRNAPPAGLKQIADAAFQLDDSRYFSDAIALGANQLVILWRETFPQTKPTLTEVHGDVLAAYIGNEKSAALQRGGVEWKSTLQAKLAAGVKFEDAVAALAGAPKSEIKSYGPFTRREPVEGLPEAVASGLEHFSAGAVSDLLVDQKGAYLVQVVEKKLPVIDSSSPEYTQASLQLAAAAAGTVRTLALGNLVEAELARTEPKNARN